MKVQAAAISLGGIKFMVVLVEMGLVQNAGEADLAIESMAPSFGSAPVVLMAQREDGSPVYYGDKESVELLKGVPIDRMPWREYSVQ